MLNSWKPYWIHYVSYKILLAMLYEDYAEECTSRENFLSDKGMVAQQEKNVTHRLELPEQLAQA